MEIQQWLAATDDERRVILAKAAERRRGMGR
jgi:predicted Fe-S protein YdhL (DUF1289 family)